MPMYEYLCQPDGHRFEIRQKFSEAPLVSCPTCRGQVKRVIAPVGIVFKGKGFYKTDNAPVPSDSSAA